MVELTAAVLLPAASPQAQLRDYEDLTLLRHVHAGAWREMARRLEDAALRVEAPFRRKYTDRAVDCLARAMWLEATEIVVRTPVVASAMAVAS